MHLNRTHAAVAALMLALLLAACGGSGTSATASAQASLAVSSGQPTDGATPEPTAGGSAGTAQELEQLIPDAIAGITLQKFSMPGSEFVSSGGATEETQDFLEGLGVSTDDVAVAAGYGLSPDTGDGVAIFVFRAQGAGPDRLLSVFKEATDASRAQPLQWQPAELGGKQVERAVDPEQDGQVVYLYATGDTLFFLAATQEDHAAEALAALP
jgi:hypothetical protein